MIRWVLASTSNTLAWGSYLSGFDFVDPPTNHGVGKNEWTTLQKFNVFPNALIYIGEFKEVKVVNHGKGSILWISVLDKLPKLRSREGRHPAPGVVEDGDFPSSKETLGNDDTPKGVPPADEADQRAITLHTGWATYATPPAFRMMCASPSLIPSSAYTLDLNKISIHLQMKDRRGSRIGLGLTLS